ncbi:MULTISPECIES: hypothetical protein [Virgibacillus]|uniref:YokE-like PH domain-containing protein n=2 Tax=Virgibacillus TaxID=84406 RepID=A0A024Q6D3_9BACI|nr:MULTISPECIES: hypothetical protein [Virgibacillus]EQB38407.1 hypothetical protein M948_07445 [Virgibacillus sp. CM-4]MYL41113.1 hypothetical protein [Virgibacillus massiliensis]GGJ54376.1 hypothetical protein GCM10007111_15750 [Virgibacillus kapii]CDQ38083.1 hypothetical protein BN990_00350 [Virgibacillus massiliensis]
MSLIAQHPYIKIERKVTSIEQYDIEHQRVIYLYTDKVVTQNRVFPMDDVMDFSFRKIADKGGILYLHTLKGVYTYTVKSSPEAFISAYRAYFK